MKTYTCGICGKEHEDRDRYLTCVTNCVAKEKIAESEAKKKRLEEVNSALNRVKQAKKYYEEQLADFEKKYPEEYKINFEKSITTDDDSKLTYDEDVDTWVKEPGVFTFSYEDNGKDKPVIKANGKDITNDPELEFIGKLLGII